MFNANVKQVINVTQVVASKMMADGKEGSIVNVSSQVEITPTLLTSLLYIQASQAALADHTVYCATKGALDMITKYWSGDLNVLNSPPQGHCSGARA